MCITNIHNNNNCLLSPTTMTMALSREEKKKEVNDLILTLSHDYTQIIPREVIAEHNSINWGNNGIGSRWVGGRFNYSIVYGNKHVKTYSESLDDKVPDEVLAAFQTTIRGNSAAGIFVHSVRENIITRPINKKIDAEIKKSSCVVCGTRRHHHRPQERYVQRHRCP